MLGTIADPFGMNAKVSWKPTSSTRIVMSDDYSLTVYKYAHIRPLMVHLYCHEDSQYKLYFMTKTADADMSRLQLGTVSLMIGSLRSAGQH